MNIEQIIRRAYKNGKLNPKELGYRKWYQYFICTTELVWARNNHDGYKIEVFSDEFKNDHLGTYIV